MPLESGTLIPDMDPNNPLGSDGKNEGDDHLRLLKRCVLGSFPAFVGTTATPKSVDKTEDEINDLAGLSETDNVFVGPVQVGVGTPSNLRPLTVLGTAVVMALIEGSNVAGANLDINSSDLAPTGGTGVRMQVGGAAKSFMGWREDLVKWALSNNATNTPWFTVNASGRVDFFGSAALPNNVSLTGGAFAGGDLRLVRLTAADILEIGQASSALDGVEINAGSTGSVIGFQVSSSRVFEVDDNGAILNTTAVKLRSKDNAGTGEFDLAYLDTADRTNFGDIAAIAHYHAVNHRFLGSDGDQFSSTTKAAGALLVRDRLDATKKVGFRNPTFTGLADANHTATLDDEGQTLSFAGSGNTIILPNLGIGTCFDVINRSSNAHFIEGDAGIALQWLDGGTGDSAIPGTRTIAHGSIVHVYQIFSNQWEIWGNGIS